MTNDDEGLDIAQLAASTQATGLLILELMMLRDWTAKQRFVRAHEDDLLDLYAFRLAFVFIAEQDADGEMRPLLVLHRDLLLQCLERGVEAAFADPVLLKKHAALAQHTGGDGG